MPTFSSILHALGFSMSALALLSKALPSFKSLGALIKVHPSEPSSHISFLPNASSPRVDGMPGQSGLNKHLGDTGDGKKFSFDLLSVPTKTGPTAILFFNYRFSLFS
jgi:hypothetical protein